MRLLTYFFLVSLSSTNANCQFIQTINGIISNEIGEPLPYANILITPSGLRNVSNADGNFSTRVDSLTDTITVSYIGYHSYSIVASNFLNLNKGKILLKEGTKQLNEVDVKEMKLSPVDILKEALAKIPLNYPASSLMLEGFYREKSKVKTNSFAKDGIEKKLGNGYKVSEAIFEIYQPGYSGKESKQNVLLELVKSRRVDVKKNDDSNVDTLVSNSMATFPSKSNPYTPFEYDLRRAGELDILDSFEEYDYTQSFAGMLDNRPILRIDFDQKDKINRCLYKGYALLDANSLAFVEINYRYSKKKIEKAFSMHLLGIGMTVLDKNVNIKFRSDGDRWVLNYAKIDYSFKLDIDRKMKGKKVDASFEINQSSEMLITKVESRAGIPISGDKLFGRRDKLDKNISDNYDPDFWRDYSVLLIEKND